MDGKKYLENLIELFEDEESDYEVLSHVFQIWPIQAKSQIDLRLLRSFFASDSGLHAIQAAFKENTKAAVQKYLDQLDLDDDLESSIIRPKATDEDVHLIELVLSAFGKKSGLLSGEWRFDDRSLDLEAFFQDNVSSFNDYFKRSVSLGMVVTSYPLPPDLQTYLHETANAYALGLDNAACALARTALERAMFHICDNVNGLWSIVKVNAEVAYPNRKFTKDDIYTYYPPFCLRIAVTKGKEPLDGEIENLYDRFSRLIHGRKPIENDSKELIMRSFRAIECLYDLHFPLNK